jgi:hypothetical protein
MKTEANENNRVYSDEELIKLINSLMLADNLNDLDKRNRDERLRDIKRKTGASNRQLSKVLSIGRGIIERIK